MARSPTSVARQQADAGTCHRQPGSDAIELRDRPVRNERYLLLLTVRRRLRPSWAAWRSPGGQADPGVVPKLGDGTPEACNGAAHESGCSAAIGPGYCENIRSTVSREPDALRHLDELFELALDLDPDQRAAFLDGCAEDVRAELEQLLAYVPPPGSLEENLATVRSAVDAAMSSLDEPPGAFVGEKAGPYQLVRQIGAGGMAVVYLGERVESDFQQRAAIKLVPGARVRPQLEKRLAQERRLLAGLEHPNIARLLDGGRTEPNGWLYLAMELVEGQNIVEFCRERNLTLTERVHLVGQVARALEVAHRQAIVHRDVKPSNILVDNHGSAKLLDFGIAQVLEREFGEAASLTANHYATLEYASPEQLSGGRAGTASDLYQLGLVLFEVVTGARPFTLDDMPLAEAINTVCRVKAPRASSRLGPGGVPSIPDELEDIIARALRKDPASRYPDVREFAADLERWERGLPIWARPPSRAYVMSKFVRRNRLAVGASAGLLVALTLGLLGTSWQARAAAAARDAARADADRLAATQQFLADIFTDADPTAGGSLNRTIGEVLDRAAARLGPSFSDQPDLELQLTLELGSIYSTLGALDRGIPLLERAVEIATRLDGKGSLRRIAALQALADALRLSGDRRAVDLDREALDLLYDLPASGALQAKAQVNLGASLLRAGELDLAEQAFEVAAAWMQANPGDRSASLPLHNGLAVLAQTRGQFEVALEHYEAALEAARGPTSRASRVLLARTLQGLGAGLRGCGRLEEAESTLLEARALVTQIFPEATPWHAGIDNSLSGVYAELGRFDEARRAAERAIATYTETLGPHNRATLVARLNLGYAHYRAETFESAAEVFEQLLAIEAEAGDPRSARAGMTRLWLGRTLIDSGQPRRAIPHLIAAEGTLAEALGAEDDMVVSAALERELAGLETGDSQTARVRGYFSGDPLGPLGQESAARLRARAQALAASGRDQAAALAEVIAPYLDG